MALVITVQADTRAECDAEMERLCREYGLERTLMPVQSVSTDRWMARAARPAAGEPGQR